MFSVGFSLERVWHMRSASMTPLHEAKLPCSDTTVSALRRNARIFYLFFLLRANFIIYERCPRVIRNVTPSAVRLDET